jgi:hypothetical protein
LNGLPTRAGVLYAAWVLRFRSSPFYPTYRRAQRARSVTEGFRHAVSSYSARP